MRSQKEECIYPELIVTNVLPLIGLKERERDWPAEPKRT